MKTVNVINLYSGLGGNRLKWDKKHTGVNFKVFSIDNNDKIMIEYQEMFPNDQSRTKDDERNPIDGYKWLIENLKGLKVKKIDVLWIGYPCQSHSKAKYWRYYKEEPYYQDFKLYEIIHMLKHQEIWDGKWVIENVIPWYKPLIEPTVQIERHLFWSNFKISPFELKTGRRSYNNLGNKELRALHGLKSKNQQWLRNATNPDIGLHIMKCALGIEKVPIKVKKGF